MLIYVVVLMLIFGVLGVIMVSLFTSSTASTVTRNDTRRAIYMAESGMRYAFSELRKADFDEDFIINTLNTITYKIGGTESFSINVFSPWFESSGNQSISSSPPDLALNVPIGEVPANYTIPIQPASPNNIYAVNYEFVRLNPTAGGVAEITGYNIPPGPPPLTALTLALKDDFNASADERIAFAVQPATGQDINTDGVNLDLPLVAQDFLPKYGGAISIRRNEYFYEERKEEPQGAPTKVVLTNLSKAPRSEWLTTQTNANDWVILSPRNYLVVPTGKSGDVEYGGDYLFGKGIYDSSLIRPGAAPPDITADDLTSNLSEQETGTDFFQVDTVEDTLAIGGGAGQFGSAFFDADLSVGGEPNYCEQGACLFNLGVRVFFLIDFISQGDGVTFTLLSGPPNNTASSAGGDVDLSELMGYAGDSRTNSAGTNFLATAPEDRGLDPPKIAVEFDPRINNDTLAYCNGANVNQNTRGDDDPVNDPDIVDQDAVQYVFWGSEVLNLLCRSGSDNSTYDDNRHGPGFWQFDNPTGKVKSSPAVDPGDGTIYVGSNDNKLYAINPDGSQKWAFTTGSDVVSSPAVGSDGTIYVGSNDNRLYAINPNGTQKWQFLTGGDVRSSPAIASDGTIYIGSDDGNMHALDQTGTPKPGWPFNAGAALSLGHPAIGPDGTIYFSALNTIYARNPDGSERWTVVLGPSPGSDNDYMPGVDPDTGAVYSDVPGNALAALNPTTGTETWRVAVQSDIDSTPIVGPDGTIYFGTDDDAFALFAVNPGGTIKWEFTTGGHVDNIPALSPDGSLVYVVSKDGKVYAVDTGTGEEKWSFAIVTDTGDSPTNVTSSPAVDPNNGIIYVGSDDTSVYALTPFDEEPRNLQGLLLTNADLGGDVDSQVNWLNGATTKGPWAVRLEVDRCPGKNLDAVGECLPDADGKFDYELRLWMKQCINDACDNINTGDEPFPTDDPFFKDTRIEYRLTLPPDLVQSFKLDAFEFNRFFFGFTAAAGANPLDVTIANFALSFIRPGDPVIDLPEF